MFLYVYVSVPYFYTVYNELCEAFFLGVYYCQMNNIFVHEAFGFI